MNRSPRLILASGSPRRRELLAAAGYDVVVDARSVDESWPDGPIATGILEVIARKLAHLTRYELPTVAADTTVVLGDARLGKPVDAADAAAMLRALSGRSHEVVTGYIVRLGEREERGVVSTRVVFRLLSEPEIELYIASGEPFDKAGAYGIQGKAAAFIDRVEGSYTNIVGLPVTEVLAALASVGTAVI